MGIFSKKPKLPDSLPSGPWSMIQGVQDGQLLLARVHMDFQTFPQRATYPFRVGVATKVVTLAENGMPTVEENAKLQELEKHIQQIFEADREAMLVVALTCGGVKEWVFYTSNPASTKQRMMAFAPSVTTHKLQMMIEPDEDWTVYGDFANPPGKN
jgi:hypothetical protein